MRRLPQVDDTVAAHRLLVAIEHHDDPRPGTLDAVLLNDHAHLAGTQFKQRANRIEPDTLHELLHQGRVEHPAAQAVQFLQRLLMAQGAAVGLVLLHGAKRVGNAGNFGGHADLFEFQPARIAGAVPAFVVTADGEHHITRQRRLGDEDLHRTGHMRTHQQALLGRQFRFLAQQVDRQLDLADILQQAGQAEIEQALVAPADMGADQHHVHRNVHRVVETVFVALLEAQQPHHGIGIALQTAGNVMQAFAHRQQVDILALGEGVECLLQRIGQLIVARLDIGQLMRQLAGLFVVILRMQEIQEAPPPHFPLFEFSRGENSCLPGVF